MAQSPILITRLTWLRFGRFLKQFLTSDVRYRAITLFVLLFVLLVVVNGLNVVNSYVGRDFMTAIADRNMPEFISLGIRYVLVFAALTLVAVMFRFTEERLGLLWRWWGTRRLVTRYLARRSYFHLRGEGRIDNPDQRIADDMRSLVVMTLSFILLIVNGTITAVAFSGVMWSISPLLFGVAVAYAMVGSAATVLLGRPLIGLNYAQLDREADFRAALIHVRENAISVALLHREGRLTAGLLRRLDALTDNFRRIVAVNRNVGFFTTGYSYMIQLIPLLIVGPMFIRGEVEFGEVTQSAMAFAQLVGAFSLIITQFQTISAYTAVVARLEGLATGVERAVETRGSQITVTEDESRIAFEMLTLQSPDRQRVLLNELNVSIPRGSSVLVVGDNEAANVALFRATADLWDSGSGRIARPSLEHVMFVPERPYLQVGTLREVLLRTGQEHVTTDAPIIAVLGELDVATLADRFGGLDTEQDWSNVLSMGEQQLLAVARLILADPTFALIDRLESALDPARTDEVLGLLRKRGITTVTFSESGELRSLFDQVLTIRADGTWAVDTVPAAGLDG